MFSHSVMSNSATPWTAACQASLSFPISQNLFKTHVHRVSDTIQPSQPLSPLLLLPSIFPSISVFSNESVFHIRWPKYWSFSFSISPSIEYSGLISLRVDWFDLFAVQGTLKSLLQHHSWSSASMLSFLYSPTITSIGEGNDNPLQCSFLENPRDCGAWWGRTESDTTEVT